MALLVETGLDFESFGDLFLQTREPLYAYAVALMLDVVAAEDVVQRAFELAFAKRATYRPELGSVVAWLYAITRNVAFDERRRARRRPAVPVGLDPPQAAGCDAALERTDRDSALLAAVNTLPVADRELIALKYWADFTNHDIAAVLGGSESSVGTRLHRAMVRLREAYGDLA